MIWTGVLLLTCQVILTIGSENSLTYKNYQHSVNTAYDSAGNYKTHEELLRCPNCPRLSYTQQRKGLNTPVHAWSKFGRNLPSQNYLQKHLSNWQKRRANDNRYLNQHWRSPKNLWPQSRKDNHDSSYQQLLSQINSLQGHDHKHGYRVARQGNFYAYDDNNVAENNLNHDDYNNVARQGHLQNNWDNNDNDNVARQGHHQNNLDNNDNDNLARHGLHHNNWDHNDNDNLLRHGHHQHNWDHNDNDNLLRHGHHQNNWDHNDNDNVARYGHNHNNWDYNDNDNVARHGQHHNNWDNNAYNNLARHGLHHNNWDHNDNNNLARQGKHNNAKNLPIARNHIGSLHDLVKSYALKLQSKGNERSLHNQVNNLQSPSYLDHQLNHSFWKDKLNSKSSPWKRHGRQGYRKGVSKYLEFPSYFANFHNQKADYKTASPYKLRDRLSHKNSYASNHQNRFQNPSSLNSAYNKKQLKRGAVKHWAPYALRQGYNSVDQQN